MLSLGTYDFQANIHLYEWQGINILLDVNSGAVHVLDDISCRWVKSLIAWGGDVDQVRRELGAELGREQLLEIEAELENLHAAEALFTVSDELNISFTNLNIKAICLNIAHACNMKCRYCFASADGSWADPGLMSPHTGKRAVDFLIEHSGDNRNLEVDFFGGEPLLNFDVLQEVVRYGRNRGAECGKHFNFTLTSNALLLNEAVQEFVLENDLSVILSLDGRPEVNDRHRILNGGGGSYHTILPNIRSMVAKKPVSYYVRGTFTRKNLDFSKDLEHIVELGLDCLSLEPAVGSNTDFSIQAEDLPEVLAEYERLTGILLDYYRQGKPVHFFHYNLDLQKGPCLAKRYSGCGAGTEYLAVTPSGDIYPCHQFIGEPEFYMGNVHQGIVDADIRRRFANNQLPNKKTCMQCWARYFCGGGCHANAYHSNGNIGRPSQVACTMHKKRIEGAIYLEVAKKLNIAN